MATVNSPLYVKQVGSAGGSPANSYPASKVAGGKLRFWEVETTVGTLATNDVVRLCKLKVGSRVVPAYSKILCENPGTTFTVSVGDAASSTKYMAAKALGGAVQDVFMSSTPGTACYVGVDVDDGNQDILLTVTSAASTTAASKIKVLLAVLDE